MKKPVFAAVILSASLIPIIVGAQKNFEIKKLLLTKIAGLNSTSTLRVADQGLFVVDTSISPDGDTVFTERVYDASDGRLIWFDKPLPGLPAT